MYVYALSFRGFETSSQQSLQALEMVYLHIWETGKCRPTSCNVHCLCYFEKWNLWNLTAQSGKIAIIYYIYCHNILPFVCMILHAGKCTEWSFMPESTPKAASEVERPASRRTCGKSCRQWRSELPWAANQFSGLVFVCKMHTNAYKCIQGIAKSYQKLLKENASQD